MKNGLSRRVALGTLVLVACAGVASSSTDRTTALPTIPTWQLGGGKAGARLGAAVSSAGDVNGDGFADILVGAPGFDSPASPGAHEGRALVYLGSPLGPSTRPVWSVDGAQSGFGSAVASAGDVNGDGYDDIIVGEPALVTNGAHPRLIGGAFVYSGAPSGPSGTPVWTGHGGLDMPFGATLASAGDVNADGYDDVLVGAPPAVYLYLGSAAGLSAGPAWSVQTSRDSPTGRLGSTLTGAGDVNGDGFDDVLIGESGYGITGRVYLYYGSASGLSSTSDWTFTGVIDSNDPFSKANAGCSLTSGNFDGDSYSDILIGCPGRSVSPYFRGSPSGPVQTSWGCACSFLYRNAGDVNGDGFDDLINADPYGTTMSIYPGGAAGPAVSPIWSAALPQSAIDLIAIAGAGDTDGDHLANVLVGNGSFDFSQTDDGVAALYLGPEVVTHPPSAAIAAPASVECDRPLAGRTGLDGAGSGDEDSTPGTHDDIVSFEWFENGSMGLQPLGTGENLTVDFPLGPHTVTLKVTDFTGRIDSTSATVTVVDTTPPGLTVHAEPGTLWPPNHGMVLTFFPWNAVDLCQPSSIGIELVAVASSEPDDATADFDGATTSDIQGAEPGTTDRDFFLRAERDRRGTGRIYTATYRARDASGNTTTAPATVIVPIDQGSGPEPLLLQVQPESPGSTNVRITWPPIPGATGYDVVTGDLGNWYVADGVLDVGYAVALEWSTTSTSVVEPAGMPLPLVGSAAFYLVQQRISDVGVGYGTESAPYPRAVTYCDGGCP